MEQWEDLDRNGHIQNTNINNFKLLFESDDEDRNIHRTKPNTPIILLSEDE